MSTEGMLSEGDGSATAGDARDAESSVKASGLPSSQGLEQPFSRAAHWTPGQLLFFAPGVGHPSWRTSSEEARNATISNGRPVLLVDPRPSAAAEVPVDDGRAEFAASLWELVQASADEVVPLSREFAHAAASPSPRCAPLPVDTTPRPLPLSWLSPAGLQAAGQVTISVPGRALRHIVGRGGPRSGGSRRRWACWWGRWIAPTGPPLCRSAAHQTAWPMPNGWSGWSARGTGRSSRAWRRTLARGRGRARAMIVGIWGKLGDGVVTVCVARHAGRGNAGVAAQNFMDFLLASWAFFFSWNFGI